MLRAALSIACLAIGAEAEELQSSDVLTHLVHQDCGSCHGLTLKGGLGPDIRPNAVSHFDTETLSTVILDGIPGTPMPPWRPLLSEADANWIARYLLTGDNQ